MENTFLPPIGKRMHCKIYSFFCSENHQSCFSLQNHIFICCIAEILKKKQTVTKNVKMAFNFFFFSYKGKHYFFNRMVTLKDPLQNLEVFANHTFKNNK